MLCDSSSDFFFSYYKLNEVTKFSKICNVNQASKISSVIVWSDLNRPAGWSKSSFHSKSLISFLLLYLLTGRRPSLVRSGAQRDSAVVKVNLSSKECRPFLDKFFLVYESKMRAGLFSEKDLVHNKVRVVVSDLVFFTDLSDVSDFFQPVDSVFIDFVFDSFSEKQILFLLRSLQNSSLF